MRVLHFFKTYLPDTTGGIEQVIYQLCEGTRPHGVDSQVLTLSPTPSPAELKLEHHSVHRVAETFNLASTGFALGMFTEFARLARQCDLVHFHFPWPAMDMVHFLTRHGRPTVLSYHSDIVKQQTLLRFYRPLMNRFLDSMDRVIVASPNYVESSAVLKGREQKISIIPFGLDEAAVVRPDTKQLAQWRTRLPARFFLFVGVLRYYKGLHTLMDALAKSPMPVVIAGAGPEEADLKRRCAEHGLNQVIFTGRISDEDKNCLLELCHAFVFPSHLRSEAFGISLLEAAMHGKPMISCEIGTGTSFVNLNGETGLVIPPADANALSAAMQTLWHEEGLALRLGQQAKARFDQMFTADRMCEQVASVYHEVLAEKRPANP
ncbi:glycosyltransferase family 4 protein [Pseudomonas sp. Marseille-QA0892]